MTVNSIQDVEFGEELPTFSPDTSAALCGDFAEAVGWPRGRFSDQEEAKRQGLPGALIPGIMGMGFLTTTIHNWSKAAQVEHIDTVFRAPMMADQPIHIGAVVTDTDEDEGVVEMDMTLKNDAGETRVFGTARVRLPID